LSLITADQLLCHAIGDYVFQSDWMAREKTRRWLPALTHAAVYSVPFLSLCPSFAALAVIVLSHAIIDRLRLARYLVWAKNFASPKRDWHPWADCAGTGYPSDRPPWLATWLLIIADNVLHVLINGAAFRWLP
jgi:hypothetical protein